MHNKTTLNKTYIFYFFQTLDSRGVWPLPSTEDVIKNLNPSPKLTSTKHATGRSGERDGVFRVTTKNGGSVIGFYSYLTRINKLERVNRVNRNRSVSKIKYLPVKTVQNYWFSLSNSSSESNIITDQWSSVCFKIDQFNKNTAN